MKRAAPRSLAARLFLTPTERRLRAGWRLMGHALLVLAFTLLFSLPAGLLFAGEASALSLPAREAIVLAAQAVAVVAATLLARRWLDRRSIASLGLRPDRHTLPDYAFGFGLAGLLMGAVFLALRAAGWLRIQGYAWQGASPGEWLWPLAGGLALFAVVGLYEELLSRGYHLQNLAEGLNLPLGLFLSSAVFAGLHLANPGAAWASTLGLLAAGYFLAYPWLRTRQLWLSFGLHAGWNFFEGQVFGFPVSGLGGFHLIRQTVAGPALITGGAFGPEAGLIILPAMSLGAWLVYLYTRGRGVTREA